MPWSLLIYEVNWYGFSLILFFLSILVLGFLYELKIQALNWKL
jgi:NADH-quinone oxidoreductase subunit A